MNDKNYYDILGVSKEASDEEIKKSFRNLIKKYHPDKFATKSKEEQEEAQRKTVEINEAYSVLGDPQKRQEYDNPPLGGFSFDFGGFDPFNPFKTNFGGDMFGGMGQGGGSYKIYRPGNDLIINLNISIEDIFNGFSKTLKYARNIRCHHCNGEGGVTTKCSHCNGTGQVTQTTRTPFGIMQQTTQCPHCGGTGKIIKTKCSHCGGTGFDKEETEVTLNLTASQAMRNGSKYKFKNRGCESPDPGGPCGSLYITIHHDIDPERYEIDGNDIKETVSIPYYKLILGGDININLPDGTDYTLNLPPCQQPSTVYLLKTVKTGSGGLYVIKINPVFPSSISEEEKELITKLSNL